MSTTASAASIEHVWAREVFDSRGKPTVEVEITCRGGFGRAIVPSGASTGRLEARELRDADRLDGTGVLCAVENVRQILAPRLIGLDAADQRALDERLCAIDGTKDKSNLGANAVLGVSLAAAHAAAAARRVALVEHLHDLWLAERAAGASITPGSISSRADNGAAPPSALGSSLVLPLPMVNMISGGLHAGRNLDVQDVLILPVGAGSYRQAVEWTVTIYRRLGKALAAAGYEGALVGDEGGYGPRLPDNERAFELVVQAVEAAGLRPGADVALGLDVAATHLLHGAQYRLSRPQERTLDSAAMVDLLEQWVDRFPLVSIEDGLAEDDWDAWQRLTARLGHRVQLIGDDLFVTNVDRLGRGIASGVANGVLVKPNQIGTLTETLRTLRAALGAGYRPVISARSGETEDATIADLAVATGAGQIKIGSVARSERLAKYNQLLRLEEQCGCAAAWLGGSVLALRGTAAGGPAQHRGERGARQPE